VKQIKRQVAVSLLCIMLVVSGCSTGWIQVALNDLPVVLQIVVNILAISDVAAIPQAQSAGAQAQTDLQLVQKLVNDYKAAPAGSQNAVLADLQKALEAANTDISAILSAVHIANPQKQTAITAAIGVALSTLLAIETLLPQPTPVPVTTARKAVAPVKPPSPSDVRNAYNRAVKFAYPSATI
jgi:hypothetical protein